MPPDAIQQATHAALNWLEYDELKTILEDYGFAVHQDATPDTLRAALRENILEGIIPLTALDRCK